MKGFKHTGNGPRYGSFGFPSKAGFGPSSGRVRNVSGYTRRAGKRVKKLAVGGLAEDGIVEAPGFSDFSKGGSAKKRMGYAKGGGVSKNDLRKKLGAQFTEAEYRKVSEKTPSIKAGPRNTIRRAKGGRVPGVSNPMSAVEAMKHSKGGSVRGKAAKRMEYAEGGKVSASEAKKIAQGVVKDHVQYPAPKGHKGFNRKAVIGN